MYHPSRLSRKRSFEYI